MLRTIFSVGHSVISPLGASAAQSFASVRNMRSAIRRHEDAAIAEAPFYAARLEPAVLQAAAARFPGSTEPLSPFEQLCLQSVTDALAETAIDITGDDCILLLSTTKGNIEWLGMQPDERTSLHRSAGILASGLNLAHRPLVVSNACISGSLALILAARMLEQGLYRHAVVVGCDRFSGFVFSGFQSFHALADGPCRPFDAARTGINLGEAAACMILSADPTAAKDKPLAILAGGGLSNDANHLSGPSRTGAELAAAATEAMRAAGIAPQQVGMISAHGTATVFNDEMEAKALALAGVAAVPLHSLKSYTGHTLGAAGILESVIACMAMQQGILPASLGFEQPGVPAPVQVLREPHVQDYHYLLKTASGFGGCNAALVWQKV